LRFGGTDRKMFAALPFDARAVNHMPKMRDDAHLGPKLTVFVEVDTPGITAAFGEDFKGAVARMIAPNPRIHPLPLARRCARTANVARTKDAVATVEPAVGSPGEG